MDLDELKVVVKFLFWFASVKHSCYI